MRAAAALLALVLCAAACAPYVRTPAAPERSGASTDPWAAAKAAGVDFRAIGQEPGWILDITPGQKLELTYDYGERRVVLPYVEPTYPREGSTLYVSQGDGHAISVAIQRFPCADAMSGQPYPAKVTVVIDGRTLEGCGRTL